MNVSYGAPARSGESGEPGGRRSNKASVPRKISDGDRRTDVCGTGTNIV